MYLDDETRAPPGVVLLTKLQRLRCPPVSENGLTHLLERWNSCRYSFEDVDEVYAVRGGAQALSMRRAEVPPAVRRSPSRTRCPSPPVAKGPVPTGKSVRSPSAAGSVAGLDWRALNDRVTRSGSGDLPRKYLLESQVRCVAIGLLVGGKVGFEFACCGLLEIAAGVHQELHLLLQAPPDHGIVTVQGECQRFPIVNLFADVSPRSGASSSSSVGIRFQTEL